MKNPKSIKIEIKTICLCNILFLRKKNIRYIADVKRKLVNIKIPSALVSAAKLKNIPEKKAKIFLFV